MKNNNLIRANRRKRRVRAKLHGSEERPRITIFRSNKYFYAQAIDDVGHKTVAAISSFKGKEGKMEKMAPIEVSKTLGKEFAEKLKSLKIETAIIDRGPYAYNGNVKAFAESLRENGITI
jgi:large subunit ribosomal protein L18